MRPAVDVSSWPPLATVNPPGVTAAVQLFKPERLSAAQLYTARIGCWPTRYVELLAGAETVGVGGGVLSTFTPAKVWLAVLPAASPHLAMKVWFAPSVDSTLCVVTPTASVQSGTRFCADQFVAPGTKIAPESAMSR